MKIQDIKGKEWVFQFRFWPNNNSRMYVLEGVTPCIQSMQLQAGDTGNFSIPFCCFRYIYSLTCCWNPHPPRVILVWLGVEFDSVIFLFFVRFGTLLFLFLYERSSNQIIAKTRTELTKLTQISNRTNQIYLKLTNLS